MRYRLFSFKTVCKTHSALSPFQPGHPPFLYQGQMAGSGRSPSCSSNGLLFPSAGDVSARRYDPEPGADFSVRGRLFYRPGGRYRGRTGFPGRHHAPACRENRMARRHFLPFPAVWPCPPAGSRAFPPGQPPGSGGRHPGRYHVLPDSPRFFRLEQRGRSCTVEYRRSWRIPAYREKPGFLVPGFLYPENRFLSADRRNVRAGSIPGGHRRLPRREPAGLPQPH